MPYTKVEKANLLAVSIFSFKICKINNQIITNQNKYSL